MRFVAAKKLGRPTDNPKDTVIRARVDNTTLKELDESVKELNTSRSDIIRMGIHKIYEGLQK